MQNLWRFPAGHLVENLDKVDVVVLSLHLELGESSSMVSTAIYLSALACESNIADKLLRHRVPVRHADEMDGVEGRSVSLPQVAASRVEHM